MSSDSLPRISVIVPNYNGEAYLRQCLESILDQAYANLELVFMDGDSTDHSVEIVRTYGEAIGVVASERDNGQSDAINKGILRSTGEIIAYVNSDDVLEPGSLETVRRFFEDRRDPEWLVGSCRVFGEGQETWELRPEGWSRLIETVLPWSRPQRHVFPQSGACFMRRTLVQRLGGYDTALHYSMDMEYYARAAFSGAAMHIVPDVLAGWRIHRESKSWTRGCAYAFRQDECAILQRYLDKLPAEQRAQGEAALRSEAPMARLREAIYWSSERQRLRSLSILSEIAVRSPLMMLQRPWLGGVRRALFSHAIWCL